MRIIQYMTYFKAVGCIAHCHKYKNYKINHCMDSNQSLRGQDISLITRLEMMLHTLRKITEQLFDLLTKC